MKLSENFSLEEFERSSTADANNIDNSASDDIIANLKTLCEEILQPVHDLIGEIVGHESYYIRITSGYRCKELNSIIGGSPTSFHCFGYASDCELYVKGEECNSLLYEVMKAYGVYTELIYEYVEDGTLDHPEDMPKWVHVAYNSSDSRKMLKYIS